jgi:hypothetical protein
MLSWAGPSDALTIAGYYAPHGHCSQHNMCARVYTCVCVCVCVCEREREGGEKRDTYLHGHHSEQPDNIDSTPHNFM